MTSSTRSTASRLATGLGAAALAVALAACGSPSGGHDTGSMGGADGASRSASPSTSTSPSTSAAATVGDHDAADVAFAQDMVVHHEGAIAMADLATDRAGDQRVKDLAARIRAAQGPEVQQMTGWLQAWGEPTSGSTGSMEGVDHSQHGGAVGMMAEEQTAQLSAATGTAFDRMFLEMMVVHHQGAVEMARQEQAAGVSPEATALAGSVVTSQTAEIAEMQQLLASLG